MKLSGRVAGTALLVSLAVQAATAAPASKANGVPGSQTKEQRVYCMEGWEPMLPGDYYACRALYHVQRNHPLQAMAMLREAAYWANKGAQHALGMIYLRGDPSGVAANRPLGIAWLALAAERKNREYVGDYSVAALASSAADLKRASQLYAVLRETYGDGVAGKRATRRFIREIKAIDDAAAMGGDVGYISGMGPLPIRAFDLSRKLHEQATKDFESLQGTVSIGILDRVESPTRALDDKYKPSSRTPDQIKQPTRSGQ